MKRASIIVSGVLLAMAALWGGAYALEIMGWNDWRTFPMLVTMTFVMAAGGVVAAIGIAQ